MTGWEFSTARLYRAALIGLACLAEDNQSQARHYVAQALTLAAAEGYVQTFVTSRQILLPLMRFALREGVEPRFVRQVLAQMEEDREKDRRLAHRTTRELLALVVFFVFQSPAPS